MSNQLQRKYGLFTAICMVVGIVIGSGVFFKAQTILTKTGGDMPLGILAWIIGGAIMLVCLLTFSFMGQKYERVNGLVDYAEATVGTRYGYYMGWFSATIYFPAMTSVLAWVSARYTMVLFGFSANSPEALFSGECITINLITEIIPNRIHQQEDEIATLHAAGKRNTPRLSGCKDEFIIKQMGGGNCILICS